MTSSSLNIPPEVVPHGLREAEYYKLAFRYSLIPKIRQALVAQKMIMESQSADMGDLTEEQRKLFANALTVLTTVMQGQEFMQSAREWVFDRLTDGAYIADAKLDQIDSLREPKQKVQSFIADLGKKALHTFDNVVETMLLPSLGLPLSEVPRAGSAGEYYNMGKKYLLAGLHSKAATCFKNAVEIEPASLAARAASIALRTEIPYRKPNEDAEKKILRAKELLFIKQWDKAREVLRDCIFEYPDHAPAYVNLAKLLITDMDLDEADQRTGEALKLFPDYVDALSTKVRIDIIVLRIPQARSTAERILALDPDNTGVLSFMQTIAAMESLK